MEIEISDKLESINRRLAKSEAMGESLEKLMAMYHAQQQQFLDNLVTREAESRAQLGKELEHLSKAITSLESRLRTVEVDNATTKVKVGLWGGIAGVASLVWQAITHLVK